MRVKPQKLSKHALFDSHERLQIVSTFRSLSFNNVVCQFDDLLPELGREMILNSEPLQTAVLPQSSQCIMHSEPQQTWH